MNLFVSGWAVVPQKINCEIIDSTKIVAEYKTIENIAQNFDKIFPKEIETLTAWSMGTIIILGVLSKIKAKKIILYSPALKFIENEIVLEELKKLQQNVIENKEIAIKLFSRKCGIPKHLVDVNYYSTEELSAGLDFLEKTEICEITKPKDCEISIIYGENDKIISPKLSVEIAGKLGVKPITIAGGNHYTDFSISK